MAVPKKFHKRLSTEQLSFLETFLAKAPATLCGSILLQTYPKNHTLMSAGDGCVYVYILLCGRLQAIEERVANEPYSFTEISPIEIVGDFELFTKEAVRAVTLTTLEPSVCLAIPAADYLAWIRQDADALFIRTGMLIRQLAAQTRLERQNLFLDNKTRLLHFLYAECRKKDAPDFPLTIKYTRPEMAGKLGCSVRTVNRTIQALEQRSLLSLRRGKVVITTEQKNRIQASMDVT